MDEPYKIPNSWDFTRHGIEQHDKSIAQTIFSATKMETNPPKWPDQVRQAMRPKYYAAC